MAFLKTAQLFMKSFIRSEIIFNNIVKQNIPISTAVNKYLDEIKKLDVNQNNTDLFQFLEFPNRTFYKLNKTCLEKIITSSYNIFKEKGFGRNPIIYDVILECYFDKDINFDVQSILKDMTDNQVSLNENILGKIIYYFSMGGKMNYAEILLNEMKSKGIRCLDRDKYFFVSGYIIAGQPEKAETFIKENKLNMESHDMFYNRCFGYASIGDVASLKNVLAEMKEKNIKFNDKRYFNLYERLIYGNVDSSLLNEVIDLTKDNLLKVKNKLHRLVVSLNSDDKFKYSLCLIEKFIDLIDDSCGFILTFGTSRCPLNTFIKALTILISRCHAFSFNDTIFGDMKFELALLVSQNFVENENWKVIHVSLINRAINEKSQFLIENAFNFSKKNLKWSESNLMFYKTLPAMKINGMVSNYDEIVDMFPRFRKDILPIILLKYLSSGDFDGYNKLRLKHESFRNASPIFFRNYLAIDLCQNVSLSEIKRWSVEAGKCFHGKFIKHVLSNIVITEMVKILMNKSFDEIEQLNTYMKEWNVEFSKYVIDNLLNAVPEQSEFIQSMIAAKCDDVTKENDCAN